MRPCVPFQGALCVCTLRFPWFHLPLPRLIVVKLRTPCWCPCCRSWFSKKKRICRVTRVWNPVVSDFIGFFCCIIWIFGRQIGRIIIWVSQKGWCVTSLRKFFWNLKHAKLFTGIYEVASSPTFNAFGVFWNLYSLYLLPQTYPVVVRFFSI